MGNTDMSVNVQYSGAKAADLVKEIDTQLEVMVKAHEAAMAHYDTVRNAFTGSSEIASQFESIATTENGEVKKASDNLKNIVAGIQNINVSWGNVSAAVLEALNKYNKSNGENGTN